MQIAKVLNLVWVGKTRWVVCIGGLLALVVVAVVICCRQPDQLVRALFTPKPDAVFCAGYDPRSGEVSTVQIPKQAKQKGRIQVYTKAGLNDLNANLKYDDLDGLIEPGPNQKPSRVSIRVSETEKLQVYRECGARPICRFERIFHMPAKDFKKAEAKYVNAEKIAFDARREAAQLGEKYSVARAKVIALQAQLEAARMKFELETKQISKSQVQGKIVKAPSALLKTAFAYVLSSSMKKPPRGQEKISSSDNETGSVTREPASSIDTAFEEYKKARPPGADIPLDYASLSIDKADQLLQNAKTQANELAGQMHQVNIGAHTVSRQARKMQENLEARGTRAELKDLVPSHISDWCSQ